MDTSEETKFFVGIFMCSNRGFLGVVGTAWRSTGTSRPPACSPDRLDLTLPRRPQDFRDEGLTHPHTDCHAPTDTAPDSSHRHRATAGGQ